MRAAHLSCSLLLLLASSCGAREPAGTAPGRYEIPAFIDSHVHLSYFPVGGELAARGVAIAIDLGSPMSSLEGGSPSDRLTLWRSGPMLTAERGYPLDSWGSGGYGVACASAGAAGVIVEALHAAGARVVKIVLFGPRGLSDESAAAAVARAHALGLKVAAHALGVEDARRAAALGVDVLAHTPTEALPDDVVEAFAGRAVVSTLGAFGGGAAAVDNLRRLRAAGVVVLYGTDLGNSRTPGIDPDEIALLGKAGLDGAAIVEAATTAPARFWGLSLPSRKLVYGVDPRLHPAALARPDAISE